MPDIQIPGIVISIIQVILAFSGAFVIALWLSLIIWTFRDARARSRDAFAILLATLMTIIFGPLGLLIYFLLRPPITLAELYERSLEEEALLQDLEERPRCAGCSRMVENEWIVCPDCHTQLKRVCVNCHQGLHLRWNICPYCGTGVSQQTAPVNTPQYQSQTPSSGGVKPLVNKSVHVPQQTQPNTPTPTPTSSGTNPTIPTPAQPIEKN